MSVCLRDEHIRMARELVAEAHANDGLAPVDLVTFWHDDETSHRDPFGTHIPQVPLGARLNGECVFTELGVDQDHRRYQEDTEWRFSLNRQYNDKAERIVGRRLLPDKPPAKHKPGYPAHREIHEVFEMRNVWDDVSQSWWLESAARTPDELEALLDRVDARNLREFLLPDEWCRARDELVPQGVLPRMYRGERGPVTFATSMFGPENLIFLILDRPELAARLRDTITRVTLDIARILDEEAGYTPETAPRGWYWRDDNCCLLNPDMYEFFGYPILRDVFRRYSPDPGDMRGQHSDSDMGHLLPLLGKLNMTDVNFGPNVMADEIRRNLPHAIIRGVLAPFTYSRNEEVNIVAEFLRDFEMVRDTRGLVFATAGSINDGSRLTGMRLIMAAIQRWGRYE